MADKIRFKISVTPIEDVGSTQEGSNSIFIAASEAYGLIGGNGEIALATGFESQGLGGDANARGYSNGAINYISAAASVIPGAFSSIVACEFMIIKHSGFEYLTATILGAKNTTDYLTIRALKGSDGTLVTDAAGIDNGEQPVLAVLKAGEAFVLPLRGGSAGSGDVPNSNHFGYHSTTILNNVAGANSIAIEMIVVR